MGWVKWTEEQTLATDMQSIEIAYRGAHEMACAVAGREIPGAKIDKVEVAKPRAMTPQLFAAIFSRKK